MRVISLVPSSTETLLALGVEVLACTKFCEQPALRHVGGTKNPDIDAIVDLAPDLVVLDREENRIEDHDALVAAGLTVFVSEVTDVASGLAVVAELGGACGIDTPEARVLPVASPERRPAAFVPIWRRPWMTISADTYGADVLARIGIDLAPLASNDPYPTVESAELAACGAELVLVPSEPYVFSDEHIDELAALLPDARIVRIDGQDLFWWGSRTPGAISRLAAALVRPERP